MLENIDISKFSGDVADHSKQKTDIWTSGQKMHVSRPIPEYSINILHFSPAMQAALPAGVILGFLDNLKIDMIYTMKEMNGYKTIKRLSFIFS